jgi:hypothetical protein
MCDLFVVPNSVKKNVEMGQMLNLPQEKSTDVKSGGPAEPDFATFA